MVQTHLTIFITLLYQTCLIYLTCLIYIHTLPILYITRYTLRTVPYYTHHILILTHQALYSPFSPRPLPYKVGRSSTEQKQLER